jgi:hypothetical protein
MVDALGVDRRTCSESLHFCRDGGRLFGEARCEEGRQLWFATIWRSPFGRRSARRLAAISAEESDGRHALASLTMGVTHEPADDQTHS